MSRTPDYDVRALNKRTDEKARVGAAWKNDDGTLSLVLSPFVHLQGDPDLLVTLFPKEKEK